MDISLLADDPSSVNTVAKWYFDEWCSDSGRFTFNEIVEKVSAAVNRDVAPILITGKIDGNLVGSAQLKIREMDLYPEYEYWLGGVYVTKQARGHGVASKLVKKILSLAHKIGVEKLYLQTEDLTGGLYLNHGFKPIERVNYKGINVLVMSVDIGE
ncbi:GNAT family N-acetyltransferase [Thalassotalea fusca]